MAIHQTQLVQSSDQRKKARLVDIMGGKCCICGYDKCQNALEFHHKDPKEKDFSLSANAHIAFEKALAEIKKCVLVCANCHREGHADMIDLTQYECFNQEKADFYLAELQEIKTKKIFYCQNCGKVISYGASLCIDCNNKAQRTVERPTREELKELIRTVPMTHIAKRYGVSDKAISKWCLAEGLPETKTKIKTYSDEEWAAL